MDDITEDRRSSDQIGTKDEAEGSEKLLHLEVALFGSELQLIFRSPWTYFVSRVCVQRRQEIAQRK
jgi:hypothetical protein